MIINFTLPTQKQERPAFVKFLMSSGLGALAMVCGGVFWALVGYGAKRTSLTVAVVIGLIATVAYVFPFRPVNTLKAIVLFLPSVVSTLISILLGEYILQVKLVAREFSYTLMDSAVLVASNLGALMNTSDIAQALVLGIFGSLLGYLGVIRQGR